MAAIDWDTEGDACVELLRDLIRINTVNRGTGGEDDANERACAERLADYFRGAGLEPKFFEKVKNRTSVVTRIRGTGSKPPLLLNAHLDVVEADESKWTRPPFAADIHEGYVWGRGAIDMKHMAAMSACVMALLAKNADDGAKLERDLIFAGVADEEAGAALGSFHLVDAHADEVRAEYMLGEIGAFSLHLMGKTFYPIQVAEKGTCWVRASFEGEPGHGSMPKPDSAVVKLAEAVARLGKSRLPMHPVAIVREFIGGLAKELPSPQKHVLKRLTTPQVAALILDWLVKDPDQQRSFGAMLSNTASPTILRAGSKVNVHPGHAHVDIDGRTLPGQTEASFLAELGAVLGEGAKLSVISAAPPLETTKNTPLYSHLVKTLARHDPTGVALPYMIPGFTDAKAYAKLGTKCYGFSPVRFDPTHEISFSRMYHGHDERVPVAGLKWGLRVLFEAVAGFVR